MSRARTASLTLRPSVRRLERNSVRASCWVIVLPPSAIAPRAEVAPHRAAEADGVDAPVPVEAMVLDRDDRLAQRGRDLVQGHVAPVLVQGEPGLAVRAVEDGVADPAGQPVHAPGPLRRPAQTDGAPDHDDEQGRPQDDVGDAGRGGEEAGPRGLDEGAPRTAAPRWTTPSRLA